MNNIKDNLNTLFFKCIDTINNLDYIIIKQHGFSNGDLKVLPWGKDIDFLVGEDSFDKIVEVFKQSFNNTGCDLYIDEDLGRVKLRLEHEFKLVIQFDFTKYDHFYSKLFISESISKSVEKNGVYFASQETDFFIAVSELIRNPGKRHHLKYIRSFFSSCNFHDYHCYPKNVSARVTKQWQLRRIIAKLYFKRRVNKLKRKIVKLHQKNKKSTDITDISVRTIDTIQLFNQQRDEHGNFNRFDVIVRYLAIESYLEGNDKGWIIYNKMQEKRSSNKNDGSEIRFKNLIDSVNENGFDPYSLITTNHAGSMVDGSHRLACSLYFQRPMTSIKYRKHGIVDYSYSWFESNDFNDEELKIINDKYKELVIKNHAYYVAILWPAVTEHFDSILSYFEERFTVLSSNDFDFGEDFDEKVAGIYECDNIEDWKVARKVNALKQYGTDVRVICFDMSNDVLRKKEVNGHPISTSMEKIKKDIRSKYKGDIPNYIHDVIIHGGDNFYHTKYIANLLDLNR
ncbi:hypothetical protein [Vibrio hippocampi]|uniref:ParB/Sulfiredoxin domain-containing protein n=1 Tax=Vibrio hippocampi TaxID=654686 RepID=A0ABM8ZGT1_9VIBR|nr:hypothetical protein [Vibrio hippocampi]CAH0525708.1 hypothetical protein VHP8226_01238 [Vibrio hippocampi]